MSKDRKLDDLAALPLSATASRAELERIAQCCTQARVRPGAVLCRQGAVARQVLVVEDGHAAVHVDGRQVDELVRGDIFGEAAVLATAKYDATVTAVDCMRVLVFTPEEFSAVLAVAPLVAVRVLQARAARHDAAPQHLAHRATVPAQRSDSRLPHAHA